MATQERLVKSLESLKTLINSNPTSDATVRKKEKIAHCNIISEAMCNSTVKVASNFQNLLCFSIEILLQLCDDPESDVRMIADESLNRIIRAMHNGNVIKVQLELHKEIKKNGKERSLRAALWRFAQLCHMIRPHKGKAYINNLVPCIVKIAERSEESLLETLADSLPKIMKSLGSFTSDNEIKSLLKAFLQNIPKDSPVIRRTASLCILAICINSRKPYIFITYILNILLDLLIPVSADHSTSLILGVLNCLRSILPHLKNSSNDQEMKGSFGVKKSLVEASLPPSRLIQVYELSLHYLLHEDHNVINASLETLNTLLEDSPKELLHILLSSEGISQSLIFVTDIQKLKYRSLSQISISTTRTLEDTSILLDSETADLSSIGAEKWGESSTADNLSVKSLSNLSIQGSEKDCMDSCEYNLFEGSVSKEDLTTDILSENLEKMDLTSDFYNSEQNSPKENETEIESQTTNVKFKDVNIGSFTEKSVALEYACRLIIKSFLLTGVPQNLIPDKNIRISVKSLALSCVSNILKYYPKILTDFLDKNISIGAKMDLKENQKILDILLFIDHPDPQLRGNVTFLLGKYLKSVFIFGGKNYELWLEGNGRQDILEINNLIKMFIMGLQDESSVCSRLSLIGLNNCLIDLIESVDSISILPILKILPTIALNPYWLVKVKLIETISNIPYVSLQYITGSSEFQEKILNNVLFHLLNDDDQRVRKATAEAIVRIVPNLFYPNDNPNQLEATFKAIKHRDKYLKNLFNIAADVDINENNFIKSLPKPYCYIGTDINVATEKNLSRIVNYLSLNLLTSTSRYFTFGCCEALSLLSKKFPTTIYFQSWNFNQRSKILSQNQEIFQRQLSQPLDTSSNLETIVNNHSNLLNICVNLLTSSVISHDINCHKWLLELAGNLFAGISLSSLRTPEELLNAQTKNPWEIFNDPLLREITENFLVHLIKMLNIFTHIIDESVPTIPQTKGTTVLPNLPNTSALSPIKRRSKSDVSEMKKSVRISSKEVSDKIEKEKFESKKMEKMGFFASNGFYMKLYELLKMAYSNYKTTLDSNELKFLVLLKTNLKILSQILEIASVNETGRIAEEILIYLRSIVTLNPRHTVTCVLQLLKCLFGTNLGSHFSETSFTTRSLQALPENLFYTNIFQHLYENLSKNIENMKLNSSDQKILGFFAKKKSHLPLKNLSRLTSDKVTLTNYIRLFEPMVIKSLKQYTITSDTKLQCVVLQLLSNLVQLRVNYCLLDSDQIFIGYVLKQFEFIEEGQILLAELLIPKIFQFLVHLSYEKQHSKSIINIPKIIQLCDGLMASGRSPVTHSIPAIIPIIEDIFIFRNQNNSITDLKELETTREVLFSMLLRLVEYHQVLELLALVVNESKYGQNDNGERWVRWSKQIADIVLPMLAKAKIRLESHEAQLALQKLFYILSPVVFKPMNAVLLVLFSEPPVEGADSKLISRWLGMIISLFSLISRVNEDMFLMKINESKGEFAVRSIFRLELNEVPDPLNVSKISHSLENISSEEIFARFIFQTIDIVLDKCLEIFYENGNCDSYIFEQFSTFLMYCVHMCHSGSHCKVANTAIALITNLDIEIVQLNKKFLKLAPFVPLLTLEWCYLLTLLNYSDQNFWSKILLTPKTDGIVHCSPDIYKIGKVKSNSINIEILKIGGSILFCDFICENIGDAEVLTWLLVNHIETIVRLSSEIPIWELINAVHRNSAASGLFIQAIGSRCQEISEPSFINKLLKCIEICHPSQSGALLILLIPKFLTSRQLALSRYASRLASKATEILLTMSQEEVLENLTKDDLVLIINNLVDAKLIKKHETLVSLLNRLGSKWYDLSPIEYDQRRNLNPENIKNITTNKTWFISQVKSHCDQSKFSNMESAELLNKLNYDDIISIISNLDFNSAILKDCLLLVQEIVLENSEKEIPLYIAVVETLISSVNTIKGLIPKPHQVFKPHNRPPTPSELKYTKRLTEVLSDLTFFSTFTKLIPTVTTYFETLPKIPDIISETNSKIPENHFESFTKFAVLCLESVVYQLEKEFTPHFFEMAITCAELILREKNLSAILGLDSHANWFCSAVNSVYLFVEKMYFHDRKIPEINSRGLENTITNPETLPMAHACLQIAGLVAFLEKRNLVKNEVEDQGEVENFCFKQLQSLIISLGRLPLVNSYVLVPPLVWETGWEVPLTGTFNTQCQPLPVEFLQEIEVLEQFIFRITTFGWVSRQQFEEIWMSLLSILSAGLQNFDSISGDERIDHSLEETNSLIHAASLAIQAITALLLQTLLEPTPGDPNFSKFIHIPRHKQLTNCKKFELILNKLRNKVGKIHVSYFLVKNANLEYFSENCINYKFGQVSIEYLWIVSKIAENNDESNPTFSVDLQRQKYLSETGLDLHSCLQFLLDLYSQWIKPQNQTPLRLLGEVIKSVLALSDIFTEKSQYQWMMDEFVNLSKFHPIEDEVLNQYIILGISKSVAVLTPDIDTYEHVKKLLSISLKSSFLPARIATLHGLLYLLQGSLMGNTVIGGQSEELQLILSVVIEYFHTHIIANNSCFSQSEDHNCLVWALAFFYCENFEQNSDNGNIPALIQAAFNLLGQNNTSLILHNEIMNGLGRLIQNCCLSDKNVDQIIKIAQEKLKNPNLCYALPGLQLLLCCMYQRKNNQTEKMEHVDVQSDPELFVQMIEKVTTIFDRIKKSCPYEAEIFCTVLPNILNDFFPPSEILTKVIGEFLSPHQPHPKLLSGVVFSVFEKACEQNQLALLQDWVVCSLANFTQSLPISMSVWCLTCFFMCASTDLWVRNAFPLVRARLGHCQHQDRRMLCIAAQNFYRTLSSENQRKTFRETFERVKDQPGTPYKDLLACL